MNWVNRAKWFFIGMSLAIALGLASLTFANINPQPEPLTWGLYVTLDGEHGPWKGFGNIEFNERQLCEMAIEGYGEQLKDMFASRGAYRDTITIECKVLP